MRLIQVIATNKENQCGFQFTEEMLGKLARTCKGAPINLEYNPNKKLGKIENGWIENGELKVEMNLTEDGYSKIIRHQGRLIKRPLYALPAIQTGEDFRLIGVGVCLTTAIPVPEWVGYDMEKNE